MRSSGLVRAAAAVLVAEGIAIGVLAVIELFGLGAGNATSVPTALALIVLTMIGAAALFAFAAGTLRGRSWARSGGVLVQVLAIVMALASLTLDPVLWTFVFAVGLPGVLGLVLLLVVTRREAQHARDEAGSSDPNVI